MTQTMIEKMARALAGDSWDHWLTADQRALYDAREAYVETLFEDFQPAAMTVLTSLLEPRKRC